LDAERWRKNRGVVIFEMEFRTERDKNICETLFGRLSARGLIGDEIPRLITDVLNIVQDGGDFTVMSINDELVRIGWRERVMDEISFELITFILESEYDYEVGIYSLQ
jgi:hypothetical protein